MLRPYQDRLANHTTPQLWREGKRRVGWVIPTGGGKTFVAQTLIARMCAAEWAAVYFMAHTAELVTQPVGGLEGAGLRVAVLQGQRAGDSTAQVQVCSAQTVVRRKLTPMLRSDGAPHKRCVVFIDEAHRVKSSTYMQILATLAEVYGAVYVVLMTATPYRRDGRGLADVVDALVEAVTPRELFAAGWLMDPEVYSRPPAPERGHTDGDPDDEATSVAAMARIVGDIVPMWRRHAGGAPSVYRCVNRAHARDVAARFRAAGLRAEHIDGTMPLGARELLLARLAIGGRASSHWGALDVLTSGGTILEEGYDSAASYRHVLARPWLWGGADSAGATACQRVAAAPDDRRAAALEAEMAGQREGAGDAPPTYTPLGCLGDAAPGRSRGAWIQRVGRVARAFTPADVADWDRRGLRAVEKPRAVVICHSGNLEAHGFLGQHEGFALTGDRAGAPKLRDSAYPSFKPPATVSCPQCFASVMRGAEACPVCGAASDAISAPALPDEDASVELVKRVWDPATAPPATDQEKDEFLRSQWAAWARARLSRAAQGLPPWSTRWPAARFRAKYGDYPDWSVDAAFARQFGARV